LRNTFARESNIVGVIGTAVAPSAAIFSSTVLMSV
jgi:hypothetical protein